MCSPTVASRAASTPSIPIPMDVMEARVRRCFACPHKKKLWYCQRLGRPVREDIKSPSSQCPDGRWPSPARIRFNGVWSGLFNGIRRRIRIAFVGRRGVLHYVGGALKLAVVAARLCRTPATAMIVRRASCRSCDKRREVRPLGLFTADMCSICGCFTRAKTALATQQCPEKRWDADEGERCGILARLPVVKGLAVAQRKCGGCGGGR